MASVRYRALAPALALRDKGYDTRVVDKTSNINLDKNDLVVIVKSFSPEDIALAEKCHVAGIPLVIDLCDNIFVEGYAPSILPAPQEVFRRLAQYTSAFCTPTPTLKNIIEGLIADQTPVYVIPDGSETESLLNRFNEILETPKRRARPLTFLIKNLLRVALTHRPPFFKRRKIIVWFGNHGASYSHFGIEDILIAKTALEIISQEQDVLLVVISNSRKRYLQLIKPLNIKSHYLDWSPENIGIWLNSADIAIIPNSLDAFAKCKSANRTLLALEHGCAVVATKTDALTNLESCIETRDFLDGFRKYLYDEKHRSLHIKNARKIINSDFSLEATGRHWSELVSHISTNTLIQE